MDEISEKQTMEPPVSSCANEPIDGGPVLGGESAEPAESADNAPDSPAAQLEAAATVEAVLFCSDAPLTLAKIAQIALLSQKTVRHAIDVLNERYEQTAASFRIDSIAGGRQMQTLPQYHDVLSRLHKARNDSKLSQAAMETLAIIAYRQPIIRADIEAIRGVASGEVLRGLLERQLVKIVGRAEVLGRPMLYGTTRKFLEIFGMADLADLPKVEELRSGAAVGKPAAAPSPAPDVSPAASTEAGSAEQTPTANTVANP